MTRVRALTITFWLLAAGITYGSVFPFTFGPATSEAWSQLLDLSRPTSRGDLLGNIVLFLPFGYAGVMAGYSVARVLYSSRPAIRDEISEVEAGSSWRSPRGVAEDRI